MLNDKAQGGWRRLAPPQCTCVQCALFSCRNPALPARHIPQQRSLQQASSLGGKTACMLRLAEPLGDTCCTAIPRTSYTAPAPPIASFSGP